VVVRVQSTGLCRSDWHGWMGHDSDIVLPHVPGHEFAGTIVSVGAEVSGWAVGDRVTAPFVCACGTCPQCLSGNEQTCARQQQPGFTYWGSFAEYVAVPWAEHNLVRIPEQISYNSAAALGCRFATAYRGLIQRGQLSPGQRVVVYGCGGVGLSAVMIAAAAGAEVLAVDVNPASLELARRHGAQHTLSSDGAIAAQVQELTAGGADVAVDAIGSAGVVDAALRSLRPRGKLIQLGLLPAPVTVDVSVLIGQELEWLGSHGMAAHSYPELLAGISAGQFDPGALVAQEISLDEAPAALAAMGDSGAAGVTVIHP
ncbi:MAG: Alcohol dehydrogenase GroES domain protein, partial [Frankiales bacterium]|nr:Alcohol dehydrogenase GroES domain protein [Frankiales bacterium]